MTTHDLEQPSRRERARRIWWTVRLSWSLAVLVTAAVVAVWVPPANHTPADGPVYVVDVR